MAFSTSRPGIAPRLINTTFEPSFSSKFSFVAKPSRIKISGSLALNSAKNLYIWPFLSPRASFFSSSIVFAATRNFAPFRVISFIFPLF